MKKNIKEVTLQYAGSSVMSVALRKNSHYHSSIIENKLKNNYHLNLPQTKDRDVSIVMKMDSDNDTITFRIMNYVDYSAIDYSQPNAEFLEESHVLGEFEIKFSNAIGIKDWSFYIEQKNRGNGDVPLDPKKVWAVDNNFHNYISDKLKKYLSKKGLFSIYENDNIDMENELIGLFTEYKKLNENPVLFNRVMSSL